MTPTTEFGAMGLQAKLNPRFRSKLSSHTPSACGGVLGCDRLRSSADPV